MRTFAALLLLAAPLFAADDPITLTPAEIESLANPESKDREAILKRIDGKILKLKGTIAGDKSQMTLAVSTGPKKKPLNVELVMVRDPRIADYVRAIEHNTSIGQPGITTVYVRAATSAKVERPTATYKVPDELKPKPRPVPKFETLDQTQDRLQRAFLEAAELEGKILADARKKGQTETVTVYSLGVQKNAAPDAKYLPKD